MDDHHFDNLTKTLAGSRRGFMRALAGGFVVALGWKHAQPPVAAQGVCGHLDCTAPHRCNAGLAMNGECYCYHPPPRNICGGYECVSDADCGDGSRCFDFASDIGCTTGICMPLCFEEDRRATCPEPGQAPCADGCIDISSDPRNCGGCNIVCGGGEIPWGTTWGCIEGVCTIVCAPDADFCGAECTDFDWDRDNCGGCGIRCGDGACCGGRCVQRSEAERFCNSCGMFSGFPQGCAGHEVCRDGICEAGGGTTPTFWLASWTCTAYVDTTGWFEPPIGVAGPDRPYAYDLPNCVHDQGIVYQLLDASGNLVATCVTVDGLCSVEESTATVTSVVATNLPAGSHRQESSTWSPALAVIFNWAPGYGPDAPMPEAGQLAHAIRNNGHWSVWVHDFATGANVVLADEPASDQFAPSYSHDGASIAYISDQVDLVNQVFVMNADGSNRRQVSRYTGSGSIMHVAWLPDRSGYLITIVDGDQSSLHRLDDRTGEIARFVSGWASWASTGPSGPLVYLMQDGNGMALMAASLTEPEGMREAPWMRARDSGVEMMGAPCLAADGRRLVWDEGSLDRRRIDHELLGGGSHPGIPSSGFDDRNAVWSPDFRYLAWVTNRNGVADITIHGINETVLARPPLPIAPHERVYYLSWRPTVEPLAPIPIPEPPPDVQSPPDQNTSSAGERDEEPAIIPRSGD